MKPTITYNTTVFIFQSHIRTVILSNLLSNDFVLETPLSPLKNEIFKQ